MLRRSRVRNGVSARGAGQISVRRRAVLHREIRKRGLAYRVAIHDWDCGRHGTHAAQSTALQTASVIPMLNIFTFDQMLVSMVLEETETLSSSEDFLFLPFCFFPLLSCAFLLHDLHF